MSSSDCILSGEQLGAARALLRWRPEDLAKAAGVSVLAVNAVEAQKGPLPQTATTRALADALAAAGVLLFGEGPVDGGQGVRMIAKPSASIDINEAETVQYREFLENDAPPGVGG
ncbi:helix-turn-helix domain-containing protein [Rhizobium mesoamericanum]|uniref:helix-turn-helix domain-containing protein n=1 Tax=Rhizobium mesoamericanum TaxID=1079800 RepID=UPI0004031956|nr:helix-turn-helix domain-containing protein [Rhizobium mesoamericanum]